jgi:hypothetical protein
MFGVIVVGLYNNPTREQRFVGKMGLEENLIRSTRKDVRAERSRSAKLRSVERYYRKSQGGADEGMYEQ